MGKEEELEALQDALELKQRELDLITAIDEIRDTESEPVTMLTLIRIWPAVCTRSVRIPRAKSAHDTLNPFPPQSTRTSLARNTSSEVN